MQLPKSINNSQLQNQQNDNHHNNLNMYIFNTPIYNYPTLEIHICIYQCLESESVGSARFWLPGSGSTDPDQGLNINQTFYTQNPNLKREYKNS